MSFWQDSSFWFSHSHRLGVENRVEKAPYRYLLRRYGIENNWIEKKRINRRKLIGACAG